MKEKQKELIIKIVVPNLNEEESDLVIFSLIDFLLIDNTQSTVDKKVDLIEQTSK